MRAPSRGSFGVTCLLVACGLLAESQRVETHKTKYYSHDFDPEILWPDWMSALSDCYGLSDISMPGTHDTMSYSIPGHDIAQTQSWSLQDQLLAGIRVLDIRARVMEDGTSLKMYHGFVYLGTDFSDVLDTVNEFLDAHPGETVLMRLKQEDTSYADSVFEMLVRSYLINGADGTLTTRGRRMWWNGGHAGDALSVPSLGEVRGKIVLLKDFDGLGSYGLFTPGVAVEQTNWSLSFALIPQLYTNLYNHWTLIKDFFYTTNQTSGHRQKFYMNSLPASEGLTPATIASGHSDPRTDAPHLTTFIGAGTNLYPDFPRDLTIFLEGMNVLSYTKWLGRNDVRFAGIVTADFPGTGLIDALINLNKRTLPEWRPRIALNVPATVDEGAAFTFAASEPSGRLRGDDLTFRWDYNYNLSGPPVWDTAPSTASTLAFTHHQNGPKIVYAQVSYKGCTAATWAGYSVRNVPPTPRLTRIGEGVTLPDGTHVVQTDQPVAFEGTWVDPGQDTFEATVEWAGASPAQSHFPWLWPGQRSVLDERRYSVPGDYVVRFTVRDGDNGVGTTSAIVRVIAPPVEPLRQVTGSGYTFPETPTYRATFSMTARGPSAPSGSLQYSYARTRMNFVSSAITSYSVAGTIVTVVGTGSVNGVPGFTFTATADDAAVDRFGLTIHRPDGGLHHSAPLQSIAGGSLVLSTPQNPAAVARTPKSRVVVTKQRK